MTILHKTNFVQIALLHEKKILKLTWLKQPDDSKFQDAIVTFLDFARDLKVKHLLSDNSIGININLSLQRWAVEVCASYFPYLQVQRYVRIITDDAFQQLVTYKMHESFNALVYNQVDLRIFTDVEAGTDWLLNEDSLSYFSAVG